MIRLKIIITKKSTVGFCSALKAELKTKKVQGEVECCFIFTRKERPEIGSDLTGPTNEKWISLEIKATRATSSEKHEAQRRSVGIHHRSSLSV